MFTCAQCGMLACSMDHPEKIPKNCPMHEQKFFDESLAEYEKPENHDFYIQSTIIEGIGYGQWVRLKEIIELCKQMGYKRIGMAFCRGLRKEAKIIDDILRKNGLEVISVICKTGGISKEKIGVPEDCKVHPGAFEPMCNPVVQARLLNEQNTEFNIAVGLCVGHDSLFYKYSQAFVTTLIAKDRVLAHNPIGAVYCAEGYYKEKLNL